MIHVHVHVGLRSFSAIENGLYTTQMEGPPWDVVLWGIGGIAAALVLLPMVIIVVHILCKKKNKAKKVIAKPNPSNTFDHSMWVHPNSGTNNIPLMFVFCAFNNL